MTSRASKLTFLGVAGLFVVGFMTRLGCEGLYACSFGTYDAEIVVTNLTERAPLKDSVVWTYINNGDLVLSSSKEPDYTTTDEAGRATISFERAVTAPLYIRVNSPENEARIDFDVYPEDIRKGEEFTIIETEKFATGRRERDRIELRLKVTDWSLWSN